jgi:hypothetical protein
MPMLHCDSCANPSTKKQDGGGQKVTKLNLLLPETFGASAAAGALGPARKNECEKNTF